MVDALKSLGYNATLFRVLGLENNLRDQGMEQIAIILRVVHNQILIPLHLREVCDRKQYLKISLFKKDLTILSTGRNRPGEGAMNQMLITIPSDGPPCPLPNFSFLQNGNAKVLIRPYISNKFFSSVEHVGGFKAGVGVAVGPAVLVDPATLDVVHVSSLNHAFIDALMTEAINSAVEAEFQQENMTEMFSNAFQGGGAGVTEEDENDDMETETLPKIRVSGCLDVLNC